MATQETMNKVNEAVSKDGFRLDSLVSRYRDARDRMDDMKDRVEGQMELMKKKGTWTLYCKDRGFVTTCDVHDWLA